MNFFTINSDFDRPERKGQGAKVPGSEMARERKGQGASWPGSEKARYRFNPPHLHLAPPLMVPRLSFADMFRIGKLESMTYPVVLFA